MAATFYPLHLGDILAICDSISNTAIDRGILVMSHVRANILFNIIHNYNTYYNYNMSYNFSNERIFMTSRGVL